MVANPACESRFPVFYDIQTVDIHVLVSATVVPLCFMIHRLLIYWFQPPMFHSSGGSEPAVGQPLPQAPPHHLPHQGPAPVHADDWQSPSGAYHHQLMAIFNADIIAIISTQLYYWLKSLQSKAFSRAKCVIMYNVLFCDWRFSVITMVTLGGRTFLFTAVVPRCLTYPTTPKTQRVPATRQKITPSRYATLAALFILVVYNVW